MGQQAAAEHQATRPQLPVAAFLGEAPMIAIPLQRADPPSEMLRRRALIHSQQGFADAGHERLTLQPLHISSSFSTAGRPIHRQCDDGAFGST